MKMIIEMKHKTANSRAFFAMIIHIDTQS